MVISVNGSPITLDVDTILLWVLVGLVAGFLASHIALGHGLGLFWDIIVGILGALFGGIVLAGMLHFSIAIAGHPIISSIIMAFSCARPRAERGRGGETPRTSRR